MVARRHKKKSAKHRNRGSSHDSIANKIIHEIINAKYDITENEVNLVKDTLNYSTETRTMTSLMKRDLESVTSSIFKSRRKLIEKKISVDILKASIREKKDIVKKASSYVSHMKTKLTNEKIQMLNTQKDLLEITKAIDDITKVTSKLSDADADAATYGLKASLIAKEANSKKAEVQYNSTEKLANQAANRHEDAVKALEKLERSFTHESSNLKLITDNMKDAFDTLTNTYNDVKELSLSLLDEAFVPEKSSQTTDTLAAQ